MSGAHGEDPVHPRVTFDSYVIPETVQDKQIIRSAFTLSPMMVASGVIALLMFVLGILVTLQFMGPREVIVTERVVTQPAAPETALATAADEVTRQEPADILTPVTELSQPEIAVPALEAAVIKGLQPERTVGKLTKEEMAQRAVEAQAIVNRNKFRMLREGVLAGVYSVKAKTENGRKRLVLETVNAEMSQQSMSHLLRQAAERGELDIPASLITADGEYDMDTLLFNLVQNSLANDGTVEGAEAARDMSRRAFAASDAKTKEVKGQRIYKVEPGDSLAYISLQFYGRPSAYLRIFEANREILSSPDKIQIGQRLIIPG